MVGIFRQAGRRANAIGVAITACLGLIASYAAVQLNGTKTGLLLTLAAVLGPVILVLAITSPVLFPFSLFAFLTPFDALLALNGGSGGTLTALLGAASAAAFLFYGVRTKRFSDPDASVAVWFIYTLWIVASAFWAIDSNLTLTLLPTALQLFGLYAVVSLVRVQDREMLTVLKFTAAGGVAAALYLIYLTHTGIAVHQDRAFLRTNGYYWNPDFLSTALILPVMIAITGAIWSRNGFARFACLAGVGIILVAMILTGARGPQLGVLCAVCYLIVRDPHRWKLVSACGGLGALAAIFYGPSLASRWAQAATDGGAGRMDIWRVGWLAFKHNWLYGAGFNNFQQAYNRVFLQVFQPLNIGWSHDSHNIVVGNAVELGIIGLSLLLFGWYTQFRALRHVRADDPRFPIRLSLEAAIIGLFVAGLFADIMIVKCSWLAFMLVNLARNATAPSRAPVAAVRIPQHA